MISIREFFKKLKINSKKLITIFVLTILEVVFLLWGYEWRFHPIELVPIIQFFLIFENKDKWAKMSEEEKKEILLSEDELSSLIKGVHILIKLGKNPEEILNIIKKESLE